MFDGTAGRWFKIYLSSGMNPYEERVLSEMKIWRMQMNKKASIGNRMAKNVQVRLNKLIPEKAHRVITYTIEKMVNAVLFSTKFVTSRPRIDSSFQLREAYAKQQIEFYQKTASVEGAVTGA